MLRESIYIKSVGSIREIEIEELKPLTLFVGKTASGKSTILKVVVLMRYLYKMVNIRSYLKNAKIPKSPFRFRLDKLLQDGMKELVTKDSIIRYKVTVDGAEYSIEIAKKKRSANISIKNKDLVFFKEAFIAETRNIIPTWMSRVSANKGAKLGFYFHETFSSFDAATDIIDGLNIAFLDLALRIRRTKYGKQFLISSIESPESFQINLNHASSGTQFVVPLLAILRYYAHEFSFKEAFQRSVLNYLYEQEQLSRFRPEIEQGDLSKYIHVHLEEPELSLDPNAQRELISTMVRQVFYDHAADRELHLLLATHSPYIVNQINVLLRASYSKNNVPYPALNPEWVDVYVVEDGTISSLMATDNTSGQAVVNTLRFAQPMEAIYKEYQEIKTE